MSLLRYLNGFIGTMNLIKIASLTFQIEMSKKLKNLPKIFIPLSL